MNKQSWVGLFTLGILFAVCPTPAEAHFRLVMPPSWLTEDPLGSPQKGSPCGPGNRMLILGDDVQPVPVSNIVTTFSAGQTISLQLEETVYHPGYFRVSLARTKPAEASTTDFPNPPLTDTVNCHYDRAAVPTGAHDNVLADGLFTAEGQDGTGRSLMQSIKLPDEPCEDCTLQVVQVMEGHPGSSCFYFHCAALQIVAADAARLPDAGDSKDARDGADAGNADTLPGETGVASPRSDAGTGAAASDNGGCSVRPLAEHRREASGWSLLGIAVAVLARRLRRR